MTYSFHTRQHQYASWLFGGLFILFLCLSAAAAPDWIAMAGAGGLSIWAWRDHMEARFLYHRSAAKEDKERGGV